MPEIEPPSAAEEEFWRALMRVVTSLPRRLDSDMIRSAGVTANEYVTLMSLSEAPNRERRMAGTPVDAADPCGSG